jgi:hypothetical protein
MDYFQTLLNEIDANISIETDKMLEASKKLKEATDKIEELKRQKETVLLLTNRTSKEY